jgi:hypothetical protein
MRARQTTVLARGAVDLPGLRTTAKEVGARHHVVIERKPGEEVIRLRPYETRRRRNHYFPLPLESLATVAVDLRELARVAEAIGAEDRIIIELRGIREPVLIRPQDKSRQSEGFLMPLDPCGI